MNIAPFTFAPTAPLNLFYADGDVTEYTAITDEDYAAKRILDAVRSSEGQPYAQRMGIIEAVCRREMRGVFDATVAQFMNDPIISEPTTRHSHQRGAK